MTGLDHLLTAEKCKCECILLLTIEANAIFKMCLVTLSVIPLCPESPVLQPERCPDCVGHTQATCQPHTGLRKPEATDGVPELRQLHISTPLRERERKRQGEQEEIDVELVY